MKIEKPNFHIYFKDSRDMEEIKSKSVKLFISGSLYLGNDWEDYKGLYKTLYLNNCKRILRDDGFLVIQQTDGYKNNQVFLKSQSLLKLLLSHYKLIDVKIWKKMKVNFYQLPFSYFYIFTKKHNKVGRQSLMNKEYAQGIWDYPQTAGSELNSWNGDLCNLLINTFTEPEDIIVDPLAGTCKILSIGTSKNRDCYGYEINEGLYELITHLYNRYNRGLLK